MPGDKPTVKQKRVVRIRFQMPEAVRQLHKRLLPAERRLRQIPCHHITRKFNHEAYPLPSAEIEVLIAHILSKIEPFRAVGWKRQYLRRAEAMQSQMSDVVKALESTDEIEP